ncbi:MAG TPA: UDP-2,3-diacylglucosamine diphosphatase [Thermodesulfobacteriota bacterium]|nr:UDP-2,3-diacylglucosamine diphosphatase [Thermodesulfobacteriota bacterium]
MGTEKGWVFVSDAHFTGQESEGMASFLRFLDAQREGTGDLVILGDLFEFLFGFKDAHHQENFPSAPKPFPFPEYLPIFEGLKRLFQQGIRIKYFEGNHDFFLHSFFQDWFNMEVEVYPEGCEERLGGRRSFIAHGDLSNPMQWKYRCFRRIFKNRWMFRLIEFAGPYWSRRLALKMSSKSHQRYHATHSQGMAAAFHSFAHQKFEEGFEVVILAHSHFPEKVEEWIKGRRCLYFNVGDWMTHRSYLTFTPPDHFELSQFNKR